MSSWWATVRFQLIYRLCPAQPFLPAFTYSEGCNPMDGGNRVATSPQSSDGFSRDLVVRQEPPAARASLVYMEPLQAAFNNTPAEDAGGGIPVVWQIIVEHKLAIVLLAILGIAGGLLVSMLQVPIYDARTTVEFQSS